MQAWNEFLFALTLTKTMDMRTVPVGIEMLMGQHAYEWNEMMAMSVLGCLPVLLLYSVLSALLYCRDDRWFGQRVMGVCYFQNDFN